MVLVVAYPWTSASSFVTTGTAGDATPLWEDVTDPTCSAAATGIGRLPLPISLRIPSPILAATFMPPRGRPTLVILPPIASSSVAPLSSASFCSATAACRPLALAASPA